RVEARVLVADRDLARDGLQKRDLFVEPLARRTHRVQADETEHVAAQHDRHDQKRARVEARGQQVDLRIEAGGGRVVYADGLHGQVCDAFSFGETLDARERALTLGADDSEARGARARREGKDEQTMKAATLNAE